MGDKKTLYLIGDSLTSGYIDGMGKLFLVPGVLNTSSFAQRVVKSGSIPTSSSSSRFSETASSA